MNHKYKLNSPKLKHSNGVGYITKDGHTMFNEDIVNDLCRLQRIALNLGWNRMDNGILPHGQTGDWDGERTDFHWVMDDQGHYHCARLYHGRLDGSEFADWWSTNDYEVPNVTHYKTITPPLN